MTDVPTTPGQKKIARARDKKLKDEVRRFGAPAAIEALVYDLLSKKMPVVVEASGDKPSQDALLAAVDDGFRRAWSELQESDAD